MSLKKALHDAGMCDDKTTKGKRDISTAKKGICLWCNDLQNTKQVFWETAVTHTFRNGQKQNL